MCNQLMLSKKKINCLFVLSPITHQINIPSTILSQNKIKVTVQAECIFFLILNMPISPFSCFVLIIHSISYVTSENAFIPLWCHSFGPGNLNSLKVPTMSFNSLKFFPLVFPTSKIFCTKWKEKSYWRVLAHI